MRNKGSLITGFWRPETCLSSALYGFLYAALRMPMVIAISSYFDTEPQSLYWSSFNKGQVRSEVAREAASLAEKAKKLLRFCET